MTLELNKIYNMDCLVGMRQIPDKSIDMILCDLPYGTTRNKWDSIIPLDQMWEQYERIIKDNGAIVLTATQPFASKLINSNLKIFRYDWIWDKPSPTGFLNAKKMPMRAHESILVFYKRLPTYNPQKTKGHKRKISTLENKKNDKLTTNYNTYEHKAYDSTERYPKSVVTFTNGVQKGKLHPTQKPVALFEYLIRTYTNEGDVVFDGCSGSGTTAVAAINTDRQFICMEKEKEYFDKSVERIMKAGES